MKVAVVGGGIAGISAAWHLRGHEVTVLEAAPRLGGHTCTVTIPSGPDEGTRVDAGFITFNRRTYPLFSQWLETLGVASRESDMSFGYTCTLSGLAYAGQNLNTWFARRRHLFHPDFLRLTLDILRFNHRARRDVSREDLGTLADYTASYSQAFRRHYLLPLGAAIWSSPYAEMLSFPASTYLRFFANHGLLGIFDRPTWRTVEGGSETYIQAFRQRFTGQIRTGHEVERVREGAIRVRGEWLDFDRVVLACHADQALHLLEDPTAEEIEALSAWRYQPNRAVVHTDLTQVTSHPRVRSSWNYRRTRADGPATLTYDMNRLQGLQTRASYLVTLNPDSEPAGVVADLHFRHPLYTREAVASQPRLRRLGGVRGRYYAGSYMGFGFHEDAFRSAREVAV